MTESGAKHLFQRYEDLRSVNRVAEMGAGNCRIGSRIGATRFILSERAANFSRPGEAGMSQTTECRIDSNVTEYSYGA